MKYLLAAWLILATLAGCGEFHRKIQAQKDFFLPIVIPDGFPEAPPIGMENIQRLNRNIANFSHRVPADISLRQSLEPPEGEFFREDGLRWSPSDWEKIRKVTVTISPTPVRFVRRASLYRMPTLEKVYLKPGWREFNMNQETAVNLGSLGKILAETGDWAYVETSFYTAWTRKENLATNPADVSEAFLVLVAPGFFHPRTGFLSMGTKLEILPDNPSRANAKNGIWVKIPRHGVRGQETQQEFLLEEAYIGRYWQRGYIPLTRKNFLVQLYRYSGFLYGWGDDFEGVDCSSLIRNVFLVFGLELPRNSEDQRLRHIHPGQYRDLSDMGRDEKLRFLQTVTPGTLLFRKNHVMVFTGWHRNADGKAVPGIFHTFTYLYIPDGDSHFGGGDSHMPTLKRIPNFRARHTSVFLPYKNGKPYLDELDGALDMFSLLR